MFYAKFGWNRPDDSGEKKLVQRRIKDNNVKNNDKNPTDKGPIRKAHLNLRLEISAQVR